MSGFGTRDSGFGVRGSGFGRLTILTLSIGLLLTAEVASGQRVQQLGHAIVEFRSPDVKAVAAVSHPDASAEPPIELD